jgi:hypothetical protein
MGDIQLDHAAPVCPNRFLLGMGIDLKDSFQEGNSVRSGMGMLCSLSFLYLDNNTWAGISTMNPLLACLITLNSSQLGQRLELLLLMGSKNLEGKASIHSSLSFQSCKLRMFLPGKGIGVRLNHLDNNSLLRKVSLYQDYPTYIKYRLHK